jgi:hypothetical protein
MFLPNLAVSLILFQESKGLSVYHYHLQATLGPTERFRIKTSSQTPMRALYVAFRFSIARPIKGNALSLTSLVSETIPIRGPLQQQGTRMSSLNAAVANSPSTLPGAS